MCLPPDLGFTLFFFSDFFFSQFPALIPGTSDRSPSQFISALLYGISNFPCKEGCNTQ